MLSVDFLQQLLFISMIISTITCSFIQKTKRLLENKKYIILYSLIINILFSIIFCYSFTKITIPTSFWIGLFSFIGADTIYKSLEGKLTTYTQIRQQKNKK